MCCLGKERSWSRRNATARSCGCASGATTGGELEGVSTDVEAPRKGDSVSVEIDPAGVVEVPVWDEARCLAEARHRGLGGYSHSIVAGGFEVRSSATRFTPGTSLTIRLAIVSSSSCGSRAQSAVIASSEVTARITIG